MYEDNCTGDYLILTTCAIKFVTVVELLIGLSEQAVAEIKLQFEVGLFES